MPMKQMTKTDTNSITPIEDPVVGDVWVFAEQQSLYVVGVYSYWVILYQTTSGVFFKMKKGMFRTLMGLIKTHTDMPVECKSLRGDDGVVASIALQRAVREYADAQPNKGDKAFDRLPEATDADLMCVRLNNCRYLSTYGIHFIDDTQEVIREPD